jgi:hypothetical protein
MEAQKGFFLADQVREIKELCERNFELSLV